MSLKWTRNRVSNRIPSISWMPKYDFLDGLTRRTSSRLNTEIVGKFLILSSDRFHSHTVLKISMRESICAYNIWFVYIGSTQDVVKVTFLWYFRV